MRFLAILTCVAFSFVARAQKAEQMPQAPIVGRAGHSAVSTGTQLIIWGGHTSDDGIPMKPQRLLNDGAIFDTKIKAWKLISMVNAPSPRTEHFAALIAGKMYVVGGCDKWEGPRCETATLTGAVYDPFTDSWSKIANAAKLPNGSPTFHPPGVLNDRYWVFHGTTVVNSDFEQSVVIFDSNTNQWSQSVAPLFPFKNNDGYGVGFADINSWYVGDELFGVLDYHEPLPKMAIYSPLLATWKALPNFVDFNSCFSRRMTSNSEKLFVVGANCSEAKGSKMMSIWNKNTEQWTTGAPFPFTVSSGTEVHLVSAGEHLFAYDIVIDYKNTYEVYEYNVRLANWAKIGENTVARAKKIDSVSSSFTPLGKNLVIWGGRRQNFLALYSNDGFIVGPEQ